jgi:phospholipase C
LLVRLKFARVRIGLPIAMVFGAACSAGLPSGPAGTARPSIARAGPAATARRIEHVIVVIKENRSFNNLFATFPGADGKTVGRMSDGQSIALRETNLAARVDFGHSWHDFLNAYDGGKMDGFDLESGIVGGKAGKGPYQYVDPKQVAPYWDIAKQYVLADHMFQTQGSGSFTAHQDLIRGGTAIFGSGSLIDLPSRAPWGCDAPDGTTTSLLTESQKYVPFGGPFPCLSYRTMRDLLDAKHISWKYYSPPIKGNSGGLWNAFEAIEAVRRGAEWHSKVATSDGAFFDDVSGGKLAAVTWLVPDAIDSDHPGNHSDTGPSWVARVVNAVGKSSLWKTSAIIIVWDDWGGFYDAVRPPFRDRGGGLGFRVAMLVVSPYARQGVSHTQYEFGSILRFIENNWDLGRLNTSDVRAKSIGDCFNFEQSPRKFVPIAAKYSAAYFARRAPSYEPVDDE